MGAVWVDVFVCGVCGARRERDGGVEEPQPPECGELHSEIHRFPDGGWLRTEQWEPHGAMEYRETVSGNPLQAQRDEGDRVRAGRRPVVAGGARVVSVADAMASGPSPLGARGDS